MNDKILVRLINIENEEFISSFYTSAWTEVFKMYSAILALGEGAPNITTFKDDDNFKYNDVEMKVKHIDIQFGNEDALNALNIYVEVYL